jgi:hypothetical protein
MGPLGGHFIMNVFIGPKWVLYFIQNVINKPFYSYKWRCFYNLGAIHFKPYNGLM